MQKYNLSGRIVVEALSTRSIKIYPFLEGTEGTGLIPSGPGTLPQEFVTPDSEGSFSAELWLNTDSGTASSGRDNCKRKAKYVDLFIVGEGVRAKRAQVAFTWVKGMAPRGNAGIVKLEEIER